LEIKRLLAIATDPRVPQNIEHDSSALTAREHEVLQLLVEGRSNREIAETLFISHRTATTHVTHILAKFGVETRAAAVTYAFQHDLV
jgi:DNA-binding CsgD family transcriptional regulator